MTIFIVRGLGSSLLGGLVLRVCNGPCLAVGRTVRLAKPMAATTWTPKVCKKMAFWAVVLGLSPHTFGVQACGISIQLVLLGSYVSNGPNP